MIAYKVVCEYHGNLYSLNSDNGEPREIRLRYSVEYPTVPLIKDSKLFVYKYLADARDQYGGSSAFQIWEAEVDELEEAKFMAGGFSYGSIEMYWEEIIAGNSAWQIGQPVPDGTYFCNSVQLIQEVVTA